MAGYGQFAQGYDLFTQNVPYDEIAAYYDGIITEYTERGLLADVGCGTGNLTEKMAALGYDVIAADASPEMLTIAVSKPHDGIQYICQSMTELDLYGEADAMISTLDSVNHLSDKSEIAAFFKSAAQNIRKGGVLAFDVNTPYKHEHILGGNTFVYDAEGAFCAWQNTFSPEDCGVDIELDLFFENEDGSWERSYESFREIALPESELCEMLESAGFEVLCVYDYLTKNAPAENSEKLMIAARKK